MANQTNEIVFLRATVQYYQQKSFTGNILFLIKNMHKIKGLITGIKGNEEASVMILPFNKRIEEYLKIIKRINQVYDKVFIDPYASFILQLSHLNRSIIEETKSTKNKPQSHSFIIQIFVDVEKIIKSINSEIKSYQSESFGAILNECQSIKVICDSLQQKLNLHETKEKDLNQNIKKYSKSHKNFLQSMDSYKVAFQDVKLIYNIEEKIKRYKLCSNLFTSTVSDLEEIDQTIKLLTDQRLELKGFLDKFKQKSLQFIQIVGQQVIKIPQNIIKCLIKSNKELLRLANEKAKALKDKPVKTLFEKFRLPFPNPQFFECELKQSENGLYPSFITNLKSMKDEHFGKSKKFLVEYYISIRQDVKERTEMNQKIKSYLAGINNSFDKFFLNEQKQIKELTNEKYLKVIEANFNQNQQQNGSNETLNIIGTMQRMVQFLDENRQLTKNMNKMYSQHIRQIIAELDEENKNMLVFKDQFKTKFYNLFTGKKEFKKDIENLKSGDIQSMALTEEQVKEMKPDILKRSQFIILLINGFHQKFKLSTGKVKNLIQAFLDDYSKHQNYESSLHSKYKVQLQQFATNFVQWRLKQPESQKSKAFWTDQNSLYQAIVQDNLKIKFDSQIDKINEFKKVKKPVQNYDENILQSNIQKQKSVSPAKKEIGEPSSKSFGKNYQNFVQENTKFEQGEKYVSNYTCGLCDNIIISGRLYITTHRLFFHSRFNSSNIFFGETKLQIPRSDIKKIEKKYNAIIFDNSISITTVNGQIFFTSLVSRDVAYELICKTFDLNLDENVFIADQSIEQTENQEQAQDFNLTIEQEDDMTEAEIEGRAKLIDEMLEKDEASDEKAQQINYHNISSQDFIFPGLNAAKMFKIFESGQQMPYKSKTYQSFCHYFKGQVHKNEDINEEMWQPNVLDFLNPSNIKKDMPLKFSRRITTNVPAPQTSIPFMPKFIESDEGHEIYFYSKDKYVVILKVKNSKAPYTDSFYLRYKKVVETKGQNTVHIESNIKIVFIKKTILQGMIGSRTIKESIDNNKSMSEEMQKYLKYLGEVLVKKSKKKEEKIYDMSTTDGQTLKQPTNQDEDEAETPQIVQLKKKLYFLSTRQNLLSRVLFFSLLLNCILLLVIFYGGSSGTATDAL